jgi:hypothetical protein
MPLGCSYELSCGTSCQTLGPGICKVPALSKLCPTVLERCKKEKKDHFILLEGLVTKTRYQFAKADTMTSIPAVWFNWIFSTICLPKTATGRQTSAPSKREHQLTRVLSPSSSRQSRQHPLLCISHDQFRAFQLPSLHVRRRVCIICEYIPSRPVALGLGVEGDHP